jgi:hypothetical protein
MSHIPGPWTVEEATILEGEPLAYPLHTIWTDRSVLVARTCFAPASEANARLIAAAPDLLKALRDLQHNANRLCDRQLGGTYEDDCRRSIAWAKAAIAKAEGRA